MTPEQRLNAYADRVEGRLQELLPGERVPPEPLHRAMRYATLGGGKRLRPAVCLGACAAAGGAEGDALDPACALELVHCFSLVHDDLPGLDDDDLRRGRPTCHRKFGEAVALLAGDALFALAFQELSRAALPDAVVRQCVLELTVASGSAGLVGGETLDILSEGAPPDADNLGAIHRMKTASLFGASAAIGGWVAQASEEHVATLRAYGLALGAAFQITDDVLNATSTEAAIGKAVGTDVAHRKQTYPALMGVERARDEAHRRAEEAKEQAVRLPNDSAFLRWLADFAVDRGF